LAFGIALVGCALAGRPGWPEVLLVALVVAGLTTSVEAVSVRGSDNVLIPYFAWLALDHTERLGLEALGDWILGMGVGVALLMVTGTRARLTTAGGVIVFLVCTLAFPLGGLPWLAPFLVLWVLFLIARRPGVDTELDMVFPTTAGSIVILLLFAHLADPTLYPPFLTTIAANGAMAGSLLAPRRALQAPLVLLGAALPVAAARLLAEVPVLIPIAGGLVAVQLLPLLSATPLVGRRLVASLACGLAVWWALP
jgi:hypothetical protein